MSRAAGEAGRPHRDGGSGTVLLLGAVAVVALLLGVVTLLVGAERARAVAQTAADLAALAAAAALVDPLEPASPGAACAVADAVAARNAARLVRCAAAADGVVTVTTTRDVPGAGTARAVARAGPAGVRGAP